MYRDSNKHAVDAIAEIALWNLHHLGCLFCSWSLRASRVREKHNAKDLKVEVKRGNLLSVLAIVEGMMDQKYQARNSFRRFVDCLFTRNIEQRPAIYFAALTGNTDIVRLFLSLLIMDRCNSTNKRNLDGNKSLTLQEWLVDLVLLMVFYHKTWRFVSLMR